MVLFPKTGLGRLLLFVIVLSTISYLVLNIVSFAGTPWITYKDVTIRFGLWRVCDTSSDVCNQWADSVYTSSIVNSTFTGSKPSYVRSSQALEIISLIFYIFAAGLITLGILNLKGLPYQLMFLAAAALLFICIIFLSASLGLMSDKGRSGHTSAQLSWAWWNGLVGLIMTIICFFSLLFIIADMKFSPRNIEDAQRKKLLKQNQAWGAAPAYPFPMAAPMPAAMPPIIAPNEYPMHPYSYPSHNDFIPYSAPDFPAPNYADDFLNPPLSYGGQLFSGPYMNQQSPSPVVSDLARQYVTRLSDAQYERELLEPYQQYFQPQDPFYY